MNILVFGNSITQGYHDDEGGGWANRLFTHLMKLTTESGGQVQHRLFNLGISGEDINGIESRFQSEVKSRIGRKNKEQLILLAVGVNDSQINVETDEHRTELDTYTQKLQLMIDFTKEQKIQVVLIGLTPIDDTHLDPIPWHDTHAYRSTEVAKYDATIQDVAKINQVQYISLQNVFGDQPSQYLTDGIHPNAEGHRLLFEQVNGELENLNIL